MNKTAQSPITVFFWIGIFILLWALVLGGWLADFGAAAVAQNSLTGGEAWLYNNLNLVVLVALTIAIIAYSYFAGGAR